MRQPDVIRSTLAAASLVAVAACGGPDPVLQPVLCTEEARPGILVEVVSAVDGSPAGDGAVLTLDGEQVTEVIDYALHGRLMWGATERPGTWDVTVERPGFRTWRRDDVVVALTPDGCHVVTVDLEARLEPVAAARLR